MKRSLDAWTLLGVLSGLGGIAFAIASWAFSYSYLLWIAGGAIMAAGVVFLTKFLDWSLSRMTWKDWLLALFSGSLITIMIVTALEWSQLSREKSSNPVELIETTGHRPRQSNASEMRATRPPNVTLPGYTSTILMQIGNSQPMEKEYIFQDINSDGSEISLAASRDGFFTFSVKARSGDAYTLEIPSGPDGIPLDKNIYVACVAGTTASSGFLRLLVDGNEVSRRDLGSRIDFGNRQWKPQIEPDRTRLIGLRASAEDRLLAPWALDDDKLSEQEANFRYRHPSFFNGDDSLLYAPLGTRPVGPSPASGTYMQLEMPPN